MKDGTRKNEKRDDVRSTLDEIAKGKLEKRKVVEKGNESHKVAKKTAVESSLSVIIDGITKSSTTGNVTLIRTSLIYINLFFLFLLSHVMCDFCELWSEFF